VPMITPEEFRSRVGQAEVVIAHAGMGTILTALELSKPLLVMPRRPERRETRNAHQIATARYLLDSHRAAVAWNESELPEWLDRLGELARPVPIARYASPALLSAVGRFIEGLEPLEAPAPIPMHGEHEREVERRRVA
jgi:UDP-N-acetylglucosamine transferase subunit ALG13